MKFEMVHIRRRIASSVSIVLLIAVLSQCPKYTNQFSQQPAFSFMEILHRLFDKEQPFTGCTLQLFSYASSLTGNRKLVWDDRITNLLTVSTLNLSRTNGLTIFRVHSETMIEAETLKYQQPKVVSHSQRCSVVVVLMNVKEYMENEEEQMKSALTLPILFPPTLRNRDKYFIVTEQENLMTVFNSKLVKSLKFKLFLVETLNSNTSQSLCMHSDATENGTCSDFTVTVSKSCQYGLCKPDKPYFLSVDLNLTHGGLLDHQDMFPDNEKNYFGHVLRLSTTTKVPQLLEMEVVRDKLNNCKEIYVAKRGLYATVLEELSERLNFSYEIVPSSGKGSTGHALQNGTWVGIVGDTYRGEVDFGFMAAITYHRFPYAELCAPINFAYLGFVTGPPRKSYRWDAIMWPFNSSIWIGLGLSIFIASRLHSTVCRYSTLITEISVIHSLVERAKVHSKWKNSGYESWSYLKSMALLIRGLLEQCEELPADLSISYQLFLIIWLLFCLVMSAAYRSKMVSLLTFPVYDKVPGTFDELATAKDFQIDFHYFGNVGYTYFATSTNPAFVKIFGRMGKEPNPLKCLQRTIAEKAACITFIATYDELLYRNLSDQYGKSPIKFTPYRGALFPAGVIHEHKAPLSVNFRRLLYSAMETGLIPNWQQEDLNEVLLAKNNWQKANSIDSAALVWGNEINADNLLRVRNLHGAFVFFGIGMTAATLAILVERTKRFKHSLSEFVVLNVGKHC